MSISSEINRIKSNIANAYSSIEEKGGILPENQNSDNLAESIDSISVGIDNIVNGIIDKFYAYSSDITAPAFVQFVSSSPENVFTESTATSGAITRVVSALVLDSNRVCMSIGLTYSNTSEFLYLITLYFYNGTIRYNNSSKIYSGSSNSVLSNRPAGIFKLNDNAIAVITLLYLSSKYNIIAYYYTIGEYGNITSNSNATLVQNTTELRRYGVETLSNNRFLITAYNTAYIYEVSSNNKLSLITSVQHLPYNSMYQDLHKLSEDKFFVNYSCYNSSYEKYRIVCRVIVVNPDNTVTIGEDFDSNLISANYQAYCHLVFNKVSEHFVISATSATQVQIFQINDMTISKLNNGVATTILPSAPSSGGLNYGQSVEVDGYNILVYGAINTNEEDSGIYGITFYEENDSLMWTPPYLIYNTLDYYITESRFVPWVYAVDDNTVYISYRDSSELKVKVIKTTLGANNRLSSCVGVEVSTTRIDGLAIENLTTSTGGNVYILD